MSKLLLINTLYKNFGGENSNFEQEKLFLREYYDLDVLTFNNSEKINIFDILSFFTNSNLLSNLKLKRKLKFFKPEIVYLHNLWFKSNLGILKILAKQNKTILVKIHNFRFQCADSILSSKHIPRNSLCPACSYNGKYFFNKYYENSYIKSFFLIFHIKKFKKLLKKLDIKIVCLTKFAAKQLINEGINKDKIYVLSNPLQSNSTYEFKQDSKNYIYAGKIDKTKGVEELLKVWKKFNQNKYTLKIVGDGESLQELKDMYASENIIFSGYMSNEKVLDLMRDSRFLITATKMYEGQPKILMEASMLGIPSIFPNYGGMKEFFPNNYEFTFDQFNYDSLLAILNKSCENKRVQLASQAVFDHFNENFSLKNINRDLLEIIYSKDL